MRDLEQLLFLLVEQTSVDRLMLLEILILVGPYCKRNPFVTLPTQDASNLGAVLRSGGTSGDAYWDLRRGYC